MPSSEYPEAVLEYVQAQGWTTNITELREGAYIVAGTREADSSPKKMLLMVVCDPENKITSEHVEYLVNAGREKNVDSVLLTHTVGITEKAREIGKEYGIGVIDSKKVRSNAESSNFDVNTDEIQMPEAESESQADLSSNSNLEERAKQIVEQAEGSAITKELLLGQESSSDEAKQVLADQPLIEYLYENESPIYIFWSDFKPFSLPDQELDPESDYRAICVISDERVLLVVGTEDGDQVVSIPYDAISTVEVSTGIMKHRLTITPEDNNSGDYDLYIALDAVESEDEVHDAGYYIEKRQKNGPGSVTRNFIEQTENRGSTAEDSSDSSEAFAGAVGERESESSGPLELIDDIVDIVFTLVVIATIIGFILPFSIPVFDLSDDIQGFLSNSGSDNNDSPEDVTEAYFQAVAESDYEAAMSYATEEAASNYSRDQFDALSSNEPEIEEVGATREISGRKVVFITVSEETVIGRNSEIMEVYFEQQNDGWYITQICYDSGTCQSGLGVKPGVE